MIYSVKKWTVREYCMLFRAWQFIIWCSWKQIKWYQENCTLLLGYSSTILYIFSGYHFIYHFMFNLKIEDATSSAHWTKTKNLIFSWNNHFQIMLIQKQSTWPLFNYYVMFSISIFNTIGSTAHGDSLTFIERKSHS